MSWNTCDLCDANEEAMIAGTLAVLPLPWLSFGKHLRFSGPAATLKVFEDNVMVRSVLSSPGNGRVLMIDAGGSRRCAMVGGNLGQLGVTNGWAGIVLDGCVRDTDELDACAIGIRAIGVHPRRSNRQGAGQADGPVVIGAVTIRPGDWVYADRDGVLVSRVPLS
ncbi:MAG: ribonuclease E activity regulator RraA [Pseudomonadota bacterium]|nr:ribonuclease E activity regulator RraA [Pseudomonadota bacterium]